MIKQCHKCIKKTNHYNTQAILSLQIDAVALNQQFENKQAILDKTTFIKKPLKHKIIDIRFDSMSSSHRQYETLCQPIYI